MSYELRLKGLKEAWLEIQKLREEQNQQRRIMQKAQEIPKRLNEFNERMV